MAGKSATVKSNVVKHPSADKAKAATKEKAKPAVKKAVEPVSILLKKRKDTPGAVAYAAVSEKGSPLGQGGALVTSIYLRKSQLKGNPEFIRVTVEQVKGLSKPKTSADEDED